MNRKTALGTPKLPKFQTILNVELPNDAEKYQSTEVPNVPNYQITQNDFVILQEFVQVLEASLVCDSYEEYEQAIAAGVEPTKLFETTKKQTTLVPDKISKTWQELNKTGEAGIREQPQNQAACLRRVNKHLSNVK